MSDYEHTDQEDTYKSLINWQVNDWFRFRGGFNRATRAPNLGELFLNPQEIFQVGGNNFGDPCGVRSTSPYGAGGTGPDPILAPTETQPAARRRPDAARRAEHAADLRGHDGARRPPTSSTTLTTPRRRRRRFNWVQQTR